MTPTRYRLMLTALLAPALPGTCVRGKCACGASERGEHQHWCRVCRRWVWGEYWEEEG
jgi:hypothetical protein